MTILKSLNVIALIGLAAGVFASCSSESVPEKIDTTPTATQAAQVDKSSWSPTYRAAREMGYEPTIAQYYADLCEMGKARMQSDKLCIKPDMNTEQQVSHLNNVKTAAKIMMGLQ